MLPFYCSRSRRNAQGIALVIVLAFVVLLTGLVVAYFSRTMTEVVVSNGSAGTARVDLLADGAVTSIIGDIKEEIKAGSKPPFVSGSATVYFANSNQTFVPSRISGTGGNLGPANLVKE